MGVFFIKKLHVFKGFRAKSILLLNVFKVLPPKHRNPHAWICEQRSKSAHLPEPTHTGTKYPRSGEPLTPIYGFVPKFSEILNFDECCAKTMLLVRFLRIRPVQSVANNPTQLSGRGLPCMFHMICLLLQLYVFRAPKWKPSREKN